MVLFDKSYLDEERNVMVYEINKHTLEDESEEAYKNRNAGVLIYEFKKMFPEKKEELTKIRANIAELENGDPDDAENTLTLKSINKFAYELFMVLKDE